MVLARSAERVRFVVAGKDHMEGPPLDDGDVFEFAFKDASLKGLLHSANQLDSAIAELSKLQTCRKALALGNISYVFDDRS
jgi:hypothetical protein